jgi:outer membrane lipoprotein YfiO/FecR-like protein
MSRPEPLDDLVHQLGELGRAAVPVEDAQHAHYRRERLVRLLGTNIEAHARQKRSRLAPWLRGAACAAAVAAAGVVGFSVLRPQPTAPVARAAAAPAGDTRAVLGAVSVRRGGDATSLHAGDVFVGGEVISTAPASGVEIGIASGHADLAASSEMEIVRPTASERRLRLGAGSVDVDLPRKLEGGKHLIVETPDAEVLVVGTAFMVEVGSESGARATHVSVRRGTVWIMQNGKQRAVLRAGDEWRSSGTTTAARPPAVAPAPPSEEGKVASAPGRTSSAARAAIGRTSSGTRPAPAPRAADSGTLEQENDLYQAGLTARARGDHAGAADTFAQLLSRYPRSVLREQALASQFRALERAGRSSSATVAARRYLASYPNGFARADAERVADGL